MPPRPFGDSFADSLRHYLKTNNLKQSQLTHAIVSDLAQRHFDHHEAQKKTRKAKGDATKEERDVYEAFPRKVGKIEALSAIRSALQKVAPEVLLKATQLYGACVSKWPAAYRYPEGRDICPNPATWFNQGRWQDDQKHWLPAGMFQREDDMAATSPRRQESLSEPGEGWRDQVKAHETLAIFVGRDWNTINDHYKKLIIRHATP